MKNFDATAPALDREASEPQHRQPPPPETTPPPETPPPPPALAVNRSGVVARVEPALMEFSDLAHSLAQCEPAEDLAIYQGREIKAIVRRGPDGTARVFEMAEADAPETAPEFTIEAPPRDDVPSWSLSGIGEEGPARTFFVVAQGEVSLIFRGRLTAWDVVKDRLQHYPDPETMTNQWEDACWDVAVWDEDHCLALIQGRPGQPPAVLWLRSHSGSLLDEPARDPESKGLALAAPARRLAYAHQTIDVIADLAGVEEAIDRLLLKGRYAGHPADC